MTLILVFSLFSCGTTKKQANMEKETLTFFSKGRCLGNCAVYDITVYADGSYRYFGVDLVKTKGEKKGELSKSQQVELNELLAKDLNSSDAFKKIRDKPITVIKYNNEAHRFHASKTTDELGALNTWFGDLIETFN